MKYSTHYNPRDIALLYTLLKLFSDSTQCENHWRQLPYFSYKNEVNMVIWALSP